MRLLVAFLLLAVILAPATAAQPPVAEIRIRFEKETSQTFLDERGRADAPINVTVTAKNFVCLAPFEFGFHTTLSQPFAKWAGASVLNATQTVRIEPTRPGPVEMKWTRSPTLNLAWDTGGAPTTPRQNYTLGFWGVRVASTTNGCLPPPSFVIGAPKEQVITACFPNRDPDAEDPCGRKPAASAQRAAADEDVFLTLPGLDPLAVVVGLTASLALMRRKSKAL